MDAAVELERVRKAYEGHVAVDDLSLAVERGAVFGLLGPNGAGKTTTIRMLTNILVPDSGTIRLFGALTPGVDANRRIGYLPEERGLYPKMRVRETLVFFGVLRGVAPDESERRARAWLDRLQLTDWGNHRVQDLSKGMQQKVQFITAVLHEPELLILDEPWSGLDPLNAETLIHIVREQKQAGRTIIFSTHLMEQAERLCDEVCIIAAGRSRVSGGVRDLRRAASTGRTFELEVGANDVARTATILADTALVASHTLDGARARLELAPSTQAATILKRLLDAGVEIVRFERVEPTLHQIFIASAAS